MTTNRINKNLHEKWLIIRAERNHRRKSNKKGTSNPKTYESKIVIPRYFRRNYRHTTTYKSDMFYYTKKSEYVKKYLPDNLRYITQTIDSPFAISVIKHANYNSGGEILIPENFSILNNETESISTLKQIISALLIENNEQVILNYSQCSHVDLSTQILLDIVLMDFVKFRRRCNKIYRGHHKIFPTIAGVEIKDKSLQKMMFSVGSPANLGIQQNDYKDIIKYKLNIHDNSKYKDNQTRMSQKELDTTAMADYVNDCLARMNKELTPEKLDDLCTVIGEILINAEEHSSTKYRFSIGYFNEESQGQKHYGVFRLVILNFGQTIYEKFHSDDCPNQRVVNKMKALSKKYTSKLLFMPGKFEEESLWTLYALQEGITSIESAKRGNGSIRFIESFFNIKGTQEQDNVSVMTICSGHTRIFFNGAYSIVHKRNERNEDFRVMTFNKTGNIEDKPDDAYVKHSDCYFPGTFISAKILLNDDDVKQIENDK